MTEENPGHQILESSARADVTIVKGPITARDYDIIPHYKYLEVSSAITCDITSEARAQTTLVLKSISPLDTMALYITKHW